MARLTLAAPYGRPSRSRHASIPLRIYRTTRAALHVVEGLVTIAVIFPWISKVRWQPIIRSWSTRLLRIFAIETQMHGRMEVNRQHGLLLVANHVSWLDIFVLNAVQPARFIAKAELRRWPVIGWLIAGVGTLFIERGRQRHAHQSTPHGRPKEGSLPLRPKARSAKGVHHINRHISAALTGGDVVAVFPEGATSDGFSVQPFHGSLLQPVVDAGGRVQPVAIRYRLADGAQTTVPAYVQDVSFLQSVWRIAAERKLLVELSFLPALPAAQCHRRELARAAEGAIRAVLGLTRGGSAPETLGVLEA